MTTFSRAEYIRHVADAVHDTRVIKMHAGDLGLPLGEIDWNGASRLVWSEVLTQAQRAAKLNELQRSIGQEVAALRDAEIASPDHKNIPLPGGDWSRDWDVGREEIEKAALQVVEGSERTPVVMYGPAGYGKSWVIDRLLARLQERDGKVQTFLLRDNAYNTTSTAEGFFSELSFSLAEQANISKSQLRARWKQEPDSNPVEQFHAVVKALPGSPPARTCLFFDVPDAIWQLPREVRNSFFGAIREWKHIRKGPALELRSVVAFSLTPALMQDDLNQSNLSPYPFVLEGLRTPEVRALSALYNLDWTSEELAKAQQELDGHPSLVRTLMYECTKGHGVLGLLARCYLPGRLFHNHLLDIRAMLRKKDSLWQDFKRVAENNTAPENDGNYRALLASGLIRSDDGKRFDVRYELLRRILHLPA